MTDAQNHEIQMKTMQRPSNKPQTQHSVDVETAPQRRASNQQHNEEEQQQQQTMNQVTHSEEIDDLASIDSDDDYQSDDSIDNDNDNDNVFEQTTRSSQRLESDNSRKTITVEELRESSIVFI